MPRDQRLVQTAVMGSAESEIPVLLPMRADRAHQYRQAHAADTFWCGQWLGGCRGRLTIKVPYGKVAHQHQALEAASARSRSTRPLAALVTTGSGMPHPRYRRLAKTCGEGPKAQDAWQRDIARVHAAFRTGPPPPGACPVSTT